ncbi:hypothetical protein APASM_1733 [Actinosynnema pretiosum subsp. pretiosum]|nr:hypothetical protein APASM_1733 [Actinosynnema pretiosum subsp. pretiosum]
MWPDRGPRAAHGPSLSARTERVLCEPCAAAVRPGRRAGPVSSRAATP